MHHKVYWENSIHISDLEYKTKQLNLIIIFVLEINTQGVSVKGIVKTVSNDMWVKVFFKIIIILEEIIGKLNYLTVSK